MNNWIRLWHEHDVFSMMAWMFWRKGSDRLFRLIMILMLIVDA